MNKTKFTALVFAALLILTSRGFSQTNLQFTGILQTDEQAIQLTWSSVTPQGNIFYQAFAPQ